MKGSIKLDIPRRIDNIADLLSVKMESRWFRRYVVVNKKKWREKKQKRLRSINDNTMKFILNT